MLIIIYEIEQQFVISASSTLLIINDLESSSLVSLSRLSGLVLQSINCTRRKRLAVQSRSCSVTPRCCLACSAACLARSFPCCLLLHAAAVLVSSPGWPSGYPAPLQPFSQEASLLKRLQSDRLRSYPSQSCYKAAVMLKSLSVSVCRFLGSLLDGSACLFTAAKLWLKGVIACNTLFLPCLLQSMKYAVEIPYCKCISAGFLSHWRRMIILQTAVETCPEIYLNGGWSSHGVNVVMYF